VRERERHHVWSVIRPLDRAREDVTETLGHRRVADGGRIVIGAPRGGVCGANPWSGSEEESSTIEPAIALARSSRSEASTGEPGGVRGRLSPRARAERRAAMLVGSRRGSDLHAARARSRHRATRARRGWARSQRRGASRHLQSPESRRLADRAPPRSRRRRAPRARTRPAGASVTRPSSRARPPRRDRASAPTPLASTSRTPSRTRSRARTRARLRPRTRAPRPASGRHRSATHTRRSTRAPPTRHSTPVALSSR
jgi:hypothetical protein